MGMNDVGKEEKTGSKDFLRMAAGKKYRIHIIKDEPFSFLSFFNNALNRSIRVPLGTIINGVQLKLKHTFTILVDMDGTVSAKLLEVSDFYANQIKEVYQLYNNDFSKFDLIIGKSGQGLKTKWSPPVPVPASGMSTKEEVPNVEKIVKYSKQEEIDEVCVREPGKSISEDMIKVLKQTASRHKKEWTEVESYARTMLSGPVETLNNEEATQLMEFIQADA